MTQTLPMPLPEVEALRAAPAEHLAPDVLHRSEAFAEDLGDRYGAAVPANERRALRVYVAVAVLAIAAALSVTIDGAGAQAPEVALVAGSGRG